MCKQTKGESNDVDINIQCKLSKTEYSSPLTSKNAAVCNIPTVVLLLRL